MTRDDAIQSRLGLYHGSLEWQRQRAEADINNFVLLGMLKLDEPKSLEAKIFDALDSRYWSRLALLHELDKHGLKIVEK